MKARRQAIGIRLPRRRSGRRRWPSEVCRARQNVLPCSQCSVALRRPSKHRRTIRRRRFQSRWRVCADCTVGCELQTAFEPCGSDHRSVFDSANSHYVAAASESHTPPTIRPHRIFRLYRLCQSRSRADAPCLTLPADEPTVKGLPGRPLLRRFPAGFENPAAGLRVSTWATPVCSSFCRPSACFPIEVYRA